VTVGAERAVRAIGPPAIDKPGVDFLPIDNILVDPAEFDAVVVDRDDTSRPIIMRKDSAAARRRP